MVLAGRLILDCVQQRPDAHPRRRSPAGAARPNQAAGLEAQPRLDLVDRGPRCSRRRSGGSPGSTRFGKERNFLPDAPGLTSELVHVQLPTRAIGRTRAGRPTPEGVKQVAGGSADLGRAGARLRAPQPRLQHPGRPLLSTLPPATAFFLLAGPR